MTDAALPSSLPTPGQMVAAMNRQDATAASEIDAHYDPAARHDLHG